MPKELCQWWNIMTSLGGIIKPKKQPKNKNPPPKIWCLQAMKLILLLVWFPALWETYSSGQILNMLWLTREVLPINAASLADLICFPNMTLLQSSSTGECGLKKLQLTMSVRLREFTICLPFCSSMNTATVSWHDRSNQQTCLRWLCLLDQLITCPSATAQTPFNADVLGHKALLSISRPQRLYRVISYQG